MELKLGYEEYAEQVCLASNCTNMELKQQVCLAVKHQIETSNCTNMELKQA